MAQGLEAAAGAVSSQQAELSLSDPSLYINRELSLLAFQERVLEEAEDSSLPLLERVKFLAIFASNIDEFFMVRVAALKQQVASGTEELSIDGRTPIEQLNAIRAEISALVNRAYRDWHETLLPALASAGVHIHEYSTLEASKRELLEEYFHVVVFPVLTPLGVDPGRPFPHISNLSLNLAITLRDGRGVPRFARLKVPDSLPQLVEIPGTGNGTHHFVWLEEVITANLGALFPGLDIVESYPFRVTRDAEVEIQELESDDLLETIEEAVWRRRFRSVVSLEVDHRLPANVLTLLTENLNIGPQDTYQIEGPLDLRRLGQLQSFDMPNLKFKGFSPTTPSALRHDSEEDIFSRIRHEDILLHHPYESFAPVVDFLNAAARDPDVIAIKMTLYRVGRNSPVVQALLNAVEEGKQVAVLVELKARFDEESNIEWARALENEGVHVVYGLVGLKVHSKIALVVRREGAIMRKYVHLGTGNYNPITARLYTDLSMFTCDEAIGRDAVALFNRLTGYAEKTKFRKLLVAPIDLRPQLKQLIEREIEIAKSGERAHMVIKVNSLDDAGMIKRLYRASQAGVKVDMLVRGICCLRPGVPGVSENIRVTSIVGRFLEHSRIFYFRNGGQEQIYLGSADLMPRNLNRRIEIVFPVQNSRLIRRLKHDVLDLYLADNVNSRVLQSDGTYVRNEPAEETRRIDCQFDFMTI